MEVVAVIPTLPYRLGTISIHNGGSLPFGAAKYIWPYELPFSVCQAQMKSEVSLMVHIKSWMMLGALGRGRRVRLLHQRYVWDLRMWRWLP